MSLLHTFFFFFSKITNQERKQNKRAEKWNAVNSRFFPPMLAGLHKLSAGSPDNQATLGSPQTFEASSSTHLQPFSLGVAFSPQTVFYQDTSHREKIHQCNFCEARFASESGLWKHKNKIHLKKATYVCPFCGKGYFDKNRHEDHIVNVHNKTKSHKCPYCPSWFAYKSSLAPHIRDKHGREAAPPAEDRAEEQDHLHWFQLQITENCNKHGQFFGVRNLVI